MDSIRNTMPLFLFSAVYCPQKPPLSWASVRGSSAHHISLVHIHKCVCPRIYECEDGPLSPLKMPHQTSVLDTLAGESSPGDGLSALKDLWLSSLHTGDQLPRGDAPLLFSGWCPEGRPLLVRGACLLHLRGLAAHHLCT